MPFVPDSKPSTGRFVPDDAGAAFARGEANTMIPDTPPQPKPGKEPSTADAMIAGAPEAGLSMGTGMLAQFGGDVVGLVRAITSGKFGTPEGVAEGGKAAKEFTEEHTYQPRGEYGKKAVQTVGEIMEQSKLAGLNPATPIGAFMRGEGKLAREGTRAVETPVGKAVKGDLLHPDGSPPLIDEALMGALRAEHPELGASTPKPAMAGVGAAETDAARLRRERAGSLPVPMKLSKGQAERDFEQQRFERETAKSDKFGKPLREHFANNTQDILANFDAFVDETGAQAPTPRGTGQSVDSALVSKAKRAKDAINGAYDAARKAGEMSAPVDVQALVAKLEQRRAAGINAGVIPATEQELIRLGGATKGADGRLVPGRISLNDLEEVRKFIGSVGGKDATNATFAKELKEAIDGATEGAGGELYRRARQLRTAYAREFEDHAIVDKLLSNKPGTKDRAVAFEDVWKHSVLDGSLDDVRHLRRVLQTEGPKGQQAWKELQGQTVQYLKDQATKSVSLDQAGNRPVSPAALDKAVRAMDADGKLDFIFGKKGGQQIRDVNDIAKDVFTVPSGAVNSSGTASVLLDAIDMAGHASGMPIGKIARATNWLKDWRKSRQLKGRVTEALSDPTIREMEATE